MLHKFKKPCVKYLLTNNELLSEILKYKLVLYFLRCPNSRTWNLKSLFEYFPRSYNKARPTYLFSHKTTCEEYSWRSTS